MEKEFSTINKEKLANAEYKLDVVKNIIPILPYSPSKYGIISKMIPFLLRNKEEYSLRICDMPEVLGGGYILVSTKAEHYYNQAIQLSEGINWDLTNEAYSIVRSNDKEVSKADMNEDEEEKATDKRKEQFEKFKAVLELPHYLNENEALEAMGDDNNKVAVPTDDELGNFIFIGTEEQVEPLLELGYDIL